MQVYRLNNGAVLFTAMSLQIMLQTIVMLACVTSGHTFPTSYKYKNTIIKSSTHIGVSSIDTSFCAEAAFVNDNDIKTNQIEDSSIKLGYSYDVSSARGWMEHIEQSDGQLYGVGAYTVLRCDAIYSENKCNWKIWGLDFHMNRLISSYRKLMKNSGIYCMMEGNTDNAKSCEKESKQQTDDMISSLLDAAATSLLTKDLTINQTHEENVLSRTLMLTILWTPPHGNSKEFNNANPIIRAHAAFAGLTRAHGSTVDDTLFPSPISACLAIPSDLTSEALNVLPTRHSEENNESQLVGADAKISSWCRIRRPLEDPNRFKLPGSDVGEVLLVMQDKSKSNINEQDFVNSLDILEGLTSNLFVIYKNGTVRTAPLSKVLSGYARHLVTEEVDEMKELILREFAPNVQDAKDELWSEVFVTSAIRLIIPVNRVLIPQVGEDKPAILWESNCGQPFTQSLWAAVHRRGCKPGV